MLGSFVLSPATIEIPETDWAEPVLNWITVSMPTGSGKSTLFRHLHSVLQGVRAIAGVTDSEPTWCIDDATFEKMGALMHANSSRLLGLYDELSPKSICFEGGTFLTHMSWQCFCSCLMVTPGAVIQVRIVQ